MVITRVVLHGPKLMTYSYSECLCGQTYAGTGHEEKLEAHIMKIRKERIFK